MKNKKETEWAASLFAGVPILLIVLALILLVRTLAHGQVRVPGVLTNGGNAYPVAPFNMIAGSPQIVADMSALSNSPSWLRSDGQLFHVLSPESDWRLVGGTNNANLVEVVGGGTTDAGDLTTGTVPDARLPATNRTYNSIFEMVADTNAPKGTIANVKSYYGTNVIGGGKFFKDTTSTATTNYGTIFAATPSERWQRIPPVSGQTNIIYAEWFGLFAANTGVAAADVVPQTLRIQNAIDSVAQSGGKVIMPSFPVSSGQLTISNKQGFVFCGDNDSGEGLGGSLQWPFNSPVICYNGTAGSNILNIYNSSDVVVRGIGFESRPGVAWDSGVSSFPYWTNNANVCIDIDQFEPHSLTTSSITIENCHFRERGTNLLWRGIRIADKSWQNVEFNRITKCTFQGGGGLDVGPYWHANTNGSGIAIEAGASGGGGNSFGNVVTACGFYRCERYISSSGANFTVNGGYGTGALISFYFNQGPCEITGDFRDEGMRQFLNAAEGRVAIRDCEIAAVGIYGSDYIGTAGYALFDAASLILENNTIQGDAIIPMVTNSFNNTGWLQMRHNLVYSGPEMVALDRFNSSYSLQGTFGGTLRHNWIQRLPLSTWDTAIATNKQLMGYTPGGPLTLSPEFGNVQVGELNGNAIFGVYTTNATDGASVIFADPIQNPRFYFRGNGAASELQVKASQSSLLQIQSTNSRVDLASALGYNVLQYRTGYLQIIDPFDRTIAYFGTNGAVDFPFSAPTTVDEAYDPTDWDGDLSVPTKNAVRDKIETLTAGGGSSTNAVNTIQTNGVSLTTAATNLNFWQGANITITGTNLGGLVGLRFDASAAGGVTLAQVNAVMQTNSGALNHTIIATNAYFSNNLNTIAIAKNTLVTWSNKQYAVFIDADLHPVIVRRDLTTGVLEKSTLSSLTLPNNDNHNNASLGFDRDGYIHLCYGMHSVPLVYYKSQGPANITSFTNSVMLGSNELNISYPIFVTDPYNGDLYFQFRSGSSANGSTYFYHYVLASKTWEAGAGTGTEGVLTGTIPTHSVYFNGAPKWDANTNLWFSFNAWIGGPERGTNQYLIKYNRTNFFKYDGTAQTIPTTLANLTPVVTIPLTKTLSLFNEFCIGTNGVIYIPYFKDDASNILQVYVAEDSTGSFVEHRLTSHTTTWSLEGVNDTNFYPLIAASAAYANGVCSIIFPDNFSRNNGLSVIQSADNFSSSKQFYLTQERTPNFTVNYDVNRLRQSGVISFLFEHENTQGYGTAEFGENYLNLTSTNNGLLTIVDWRPGVDATFPQPFPREAVMDSIVARGQIKAGKFVGLGSGLTGVTDPNAWHVSNYEIWGPPGSGLALISGTNAGAQTRIDLKQGGGVFGEIILTPAFDSGVGIGVDPTEARLHVKGAPSTILKLESTSANLYNRAKTSVGSAEWGIYGNSGGEFYFAPKAQGVVGLQHGLRFYSDDLTTVALQINTNNSVSIGTTTRADPNSLLVNGTVSVADDAYNATTWDGNAAVPTKNAIRDKIESIAGGSGGQATNAVTTISSNNVAISTAATNIHFWAGANVTLNYTNSPEGDVDVTIEASSSGGLDPRIASTSGTMTAGSNTFAAPVFQSSSLTASRIVGTDGGKNLVSFEAGTGIDISGGIISATGGGAADGSPGVLTNQFTTNAVGSAIVGPVRFASTSEWTNGAPGVGITNTSTGNTTNSGHIKAATMNTTGAATFAGVLTVGGNLSVAGNGIFSSYISSTDLIQAGSDAYIGFSVRSRILSPSDGVIRLSNAGQTDFIRLQFGGTTAGFPSLKRVLGDLELSDGPGTGTTNNFRVPGSITATNGFLGRSNVVFHVPTNAPTDGQVVTASGTSGITRWADGGAGGSGAAVDSAFVTIGTPVTGLTGERALTGTANEITITDNGANSTVVLSLPTGINATKIADGTVTSAEFQFIGGLTSDAQTQISAKLPLAGGILSGQVTSSSSIVATNGFLVPTNGMGNAVVDFNKPDVTTNCAAAITFTGITNFKQGVANQAIIHLLATGTHTITFPTEWKDAFAGGTTYTTTNGVQTDLLITCQVGLYTNITKLDYY